MAALTERMETVEHRVGDLESTLVRYMTHTEQMFERMEAERASEREESALQRAAMESTVQALGHRMQELGHTVEVLGHTVKELGHTVEMLGHSTQALERTVQEMKQESARDRREAYRRWGELANKMGTVVEDIVAPSVRRLARDLFDGGDERYFATRVQVRRSDDPSRSREFDALYVGARAVLLNETKSSPRSEDAKAFAGFLQQQEFGRYYPQYRHLPIVPAFSSLSLPDDLVTYLTRRGIYALAMGDEAMQVLNFDAVKRRPSGQVSP